MNGVVTWLQDKPLPKRRATLVGATVLSLAIVVIVGFLGLHTIGQFLGGIAGAVLFGIGLLTYTTVLTESQQDKVDLKRRFPLPGRRYVVFVLAALWIIVLLFSSRFTPDSLETLVGTLTVGVFLTLYFLLRQSPAEQIDALLYDDAPLPTSRDSVDD